MPLEVSEALDRLAECDHGFVGRPFTDEICEALAIEGRIDLYREVDTRWQFKGLTVNKPDGYLDIDEYIKWFNIEWGAGLKKDIRKGVTKTKVMIEVWSLYIAAGLEGVPYTTGIDASYFACWLCRQLGVEYMSQFGRGSQLRMCVLALREHFGIEKEAVHA